MPYKQCESQTNDKYFSHKKCQLIYWSNSKIINYLTFFSDLRLKLAAFSAELKVRKSSI